MENRGMDVRESLHILAEQLPEGASWEDAIERIRFRQAVEEGKAAARSGDFASEAEVNQVFEKYRDTRFPDQMKAWVEQQAEKITRMQQLVTEGLHSGVGDRSMAELRDEAIRRVSARS